MKMLKQTSLVVLVLLLAGFATIVSCKHDDLVVGGSGPNIVRGTEKMGLSDPKVSYDKTHGNVGWETLYIGNTAILTGRFNSFGMTSFEFDESNAAGISFESWVWINSVNTSEPGRDGGCLQTTFGTTTAMTTDPANVAIIKSKSVELSTKDKGYIVKCDFTFHGVTKEVVAKLSYMGKGETGSGATLKYVYGFNLEFNFNAKSDFLIASTNIADNITVKCNAIFRKLP
jgi:polyisoprenoid-binding protein YceI